MQNGDNKNGINIKYKLVAINNHPVERLKCDSLKH